MPAREIKTTLAIDGEQKFKQEMQAAARELRVLGSEMRANTASFGDNVDSMEALTSRGAIYERQVAQQREMVAALTRAVEESAQVYGEADRRTDGYRIQLNNAAASLSRMESELDQTNDEIENYGRASIQAARDSEEMQLAQEELGKTLDIVKGAALAVAGAITGAFGAVVFSSDESQRALNGLQASTGVANEAMVDMKDTMMEIYSDNFGENLEDIGASMSVVHQQTKLTGDALKGVSEDALLVRDTFGMEVADSIKASNQLVIKFGLDGHAAYNLVAQGAQEGLDANGDLLDTIKEYSGTFKEQGFAAEEMMNMFKNGAKSGVRDVDLLGDAMKEFGIRSKDGSDTSAAGFEALGLDAEEMTKAFATGGEVSRAAFDKVTTALIGMKDPVAQNATGVALWGTQFEDLGVKSFTALVNTQGSISTTVDALKKINEVKYNDIGASLEGLKRQLITDLAGPIGDELTPKINEMIQKVREFDMAPVIDALKWVMDNAGNIAAGAASIGAAMVTWNVVTTITTVVEAIKVWRTATEGMTIAQAALNLVMSANPIGLIVTAVVALVAGLVVLWNTNEGFRTAVINVWETVRATIGAVGEWLTNFFTASIPEAIATAIDWVSQLPANIGTFFGQIPGIISNFLSGAITKITEFGSNIINWVKAEIPKFVSGFITFLGELPGKIGYALGFALGSIVKFGIDALSWVKTEVPKFILGIVTFYTELPGKIATLLTEALGKIAEWGASAVTWAMTEVPKFISNIITFYAELPGKIKAQLAIVLKNLILWAGDMLQTAKTEIPKITSNIVSFFAELPGKMLEIGGNIVKGIWDGIKNSASWLMDKIKEFAEGIVQGMKDALGINSPSRVMRDEVGLMVGSGMAAGIDNSINEVKAAMARLNRNLVAEAEISTNTNTSERVTTRQNQAMTEVSPVPNSSGGLIVTIEKFINNRAQDTQAWAEELEFYRRQTSMARGGS